MTEDRVAEVIHSGIEMELQGLRTYEEAAAKSQHPFAKEMFLSLANDERRHIEWFRKLAEKRGAAPVCLDNLDPDGFLKQIREVFKGMQEQIEDAKAEMDDIKALDVALRLEESAYRAYTEAAEAATDPEEKALLEFVAREENNHYRILDDTKLYLTDPEKWHIKEENPLIDGG